VGVGQFGGNKWGNHREPPPHTAMRPLEWGGPKRRCWRCGRTHPS
jgi:hypothetical protein